MQHAAGNRAVGTLVQRTPAAADAGVATPDAGAAAAPAAPYHMDQVDADLAQAKALLARTPPDWEGAKALVTSSYKWLESLVTDGRLGVQFRADLATASANCQDARNAVGEMYGVIQQAQMRNPGAPPPANLLDPQMSRFRFAEDSLRKLEDAVSYELADAEKLPDVATSLKGLSRSEMHVLAWLEKHRAEIVDAATKFNVDARAVAGAIAWEALQNIRASSFRAGGPGKPHKFDPRPWKAVATKEVETDRYVPTPSSESEHDKLLDSVAGSIQYVAAIMGDVADRSTNHGLEIRADPGVLTTIYQAWPPSVWEEHLKEKEKSRKPGTPWPRPTVENAMGVWVDGHLPFLDEAMGGPSATHQPTAPVRAPLAPPPDAGVPADAGSPTPDAGVAAPRLQRAPDAGATTTAPAPTQTTAPAGPATAEDATKQLVDRAVSTNVDYAKWLLDADALGFVDWSFGDTHDQVKTLSEGKSIDLGGVVLDPTGSDPLVGLQVAYDGVKGAIKRWQASPGGKKEKVGLGSFLRNASVRTQGGKQYVSDPHATGQMIDINDYDFSGSAGPDEVLRLLGDLRPGSYGLGLPFQGDFFPPEDELSAKEQKSKADADAEKPPVDPKPVDKAIQYDTSYEYSASWDATKKTWIAKQGDYGAEQHIKSSKFKDGLAALRKKGYSFYVFPDRRGHVHVQKGNVTAAVPQTDLSVKPPAGPQPAPTAAPATK